MNDTIDHSQLKSNAKLFIKLGTPKPMMVVLAAVLVTTLISLLQTLVRYGGIAGVGAICNGLQNFILTGDRSGYETALYTALYSARPGGSLIRMLLSVMSYLISAGLIMYYMQQVRTRNGSYGSLLDAFPYVLRIIGYEIITSILVGLWTLLFIIPGIIAAYRYSQGLYILLDHPEYGIMDCISESKRMMDGRKWDYFVLGLSFIGWMLLEGALHIGLTWGLGFVFSFLAKVNLMLFGALVSIIPMLLVLPLTIYIAAYQGFTFFQYYDALQGRYHDPEQPPAPPAQEPEPPIY